MTTPEDPQIKIVTAYGMNWYKNASENGGAMKYVIDNKKEGNVILLSETKKLGKMWGQCSPDKALELIIKNHGIYEVIDSYPHKLYFDIDCKTPIVGSPILEDVLNSIRGIWPNGTWAVSGSIVENVKESYHIVSNLYVIHNDTERDMVKSAVKHLQSTNDAFDWKVYTKNRNMKCINQSKADGRVQEIIQGADLRKHMICSFVPDYCERIDCHFQEELKEQIAIQQASKKFDMATLPRLSLPTPSNLNFYGMTPQQMLDLLPYKNHKNEFEYKYIHSIARFAYYNGISYQDYLAWADWEDRQDGRTMWNNLHKFPPFQPVQMKKLLQCYYPAMKRDQHMTAFANQFNLPADIVMTHIDRLSQEHYDDEYKATILHLTMGSGKTAQTIDYLKSGTSFCWIAHNKALVSGTLGRLKAADVNCKSYLAFDAKAKANGALNSEKNLCICAHSLHYLSFEKEYRTLIIDEIESVVEAFMGDFMQQKSKSFAIFKNLILRSKKVILIDAFITMKTINLLRLIDPSCKINVILQSNIKPSKTLTFHSTNQEDKDDKDYLSNALNHIITFIKTGGKCFIFYPYKNGASGRFSMEQIMTMIKISTGCRVVMYNSDVDDKIKKGLQNVNEAWSQYDCVICNSVITCGVNYDVAGFDKVFMFLASFITPRQSIQVSARIRNLSSNEIDVYYMGKQSNTECYIDDRKDMKCPVYNKLYEDSLIEDKAPRRKSFEFFCQKAPYKMKRDKFVIDKEVSKEVQEYCNADFLYHYQNIDDIDSITAGTIEDLIMINDCPMYMKFQLKKYYFKLKFEADEKNEETLEAIWDNNMFGIVD
jgi:hypothetical protein